MPKKTVSKAVQWLSDEIPDPQHKSNLFRHYQKFQFGEIIAAIGDFVLISNADAAEPDTEMGCDAARVLDLYEDSSNNKDPFRAKVQWYSRPEDLPKWCFNNVEPIEFFDNELIEDNRAFNTNVSIETFYKNCMIHCTFTKDINNKFNGHLQYICRYRLIALSKRKALLEPVLEEERNALQLLKTPRKSTKMQTPNSLVKRMSRISITEEKNWSVSKNDGTKLLLKRAIANENTPKRAELITQRPSKEEILSMELKENSEDEMPTLIIRKHEPSSLKKQSVSPAKKKEHISKTKEVTPVRMLDFDNDMTKTKIYITCKKQELKSPRRKLSISNAEEVTPVEMSVDDEEFLTPSRKTKKVINYKEQELSPLKRKQSISNIGEVTPVKMSYLNEVEYYTPSRRAKKKINYKELELSPLKRKQSTSNAREVTPVRMLAIVDDKECLTPSRRTKKVVNYREQDLSPLKRKQSISNAREVPQVKMSMWVDHEELLTPSRRKTLKNHKELESSPAKRTPRKPLQCMSTNESDDDFNPDLSPKTPRTHRTPKTPNLSKTPKRKIITSLLTPTLPARAHPIDIPDISKENKSLPGRESQLDEILYFVRTKLLEGTSGCMYISGVPGTGKTATVCKALNILKEELDVPDFQMVEVNGMKIAEPRQAYVQIYKQLTGKTYKWEQACSLLAKRFTSPGTKRTPTVMLVDELDALTTRKQDVIYSIMEWTGHSAAQLTVLAIANTLDLPERELAARVASRLGLTRLSFPPYTYTQLEKIVEVTLDNKNLTADATQLIARKVAAVSGDARRAISLCTRALELAGPGGAGLKEVQQALEEASTNISVRAIKSCAPVERLMLRAIAAEVERTGSDETTLSRVLENAAALMILDGRPYRSATSIRAPTPSQAYRICARLSASRLLLLNPKHADPRIMLNVSVDDVHYATSKTAF